MKYEDDEEDEESKEIDELTKEIDTKLNIDFQKEKNIDIGININEVEEMYKKSELNTIIDESYCFNQRMGRVWLLLKDLQLLLLFNDSVHYNLINQKGNNTWTKGNIFIGKLFSKYNFKAKVLKEKNFPEKKKLDRIFCFENGEIIILKINLYKATQEDTCALNWIVLNVPGMGENLTSQIISKFNRKKIFKKIENILEREPLDLFQYESGIIPGNMAEIWKILKDNKILKSIVPNSNSSFVPININSSKVGEVVKSEIDLKGKKEILEIKLDLKEEKKGWNKWIFAYSILKGEPKKIPKQTVYIQLTKINNNETQLSVFTKIFDLISNKCFKKLSNQKRSAICALKEFFKKKKEK